MTVAALRADIKRLNSFEAAPLSIVFSGHGVVSPMKGREDGYYYF